MKNSKKIKAFSLIELSIVILVVGIIIAGVVQSGKIVDKFRLISARTQTESSPVSSIKNLVSWYDTTSKKSFNDAEAEEDSPVSNWYDINPQAIQKNNLTQSYNEIASIERRPIYKISSQTGLPMLYFNGDRTFFPLPNGTIPSRDSAFTIFFITICICDSSSTVYSAGNSSGKHYTRLLENEIQFETENMESGEIFVGENSSNTPRIYATSYNNSEDNRSVYLYRNGNLVGSSNITSPINTSTNDGFIGTNAFDWNWFHGYIGEFIIYDRYLTDEERKSVESYLGKKWKINLNNELPT